MTTLNKLVTDFALGVKAADDLHQALSDAGIEVLLDDRGERPGVMFADMELIGIPHRITVGERGLKSGTVEIYNRRDGESRELELDKVVSQLKSELCSDN